MTMLPNTRVERSNVFIYNVLLTDITAVREFARERPLYSTVKVTKPPDLRHIYKSYRESYIIFQVNRDLINLEKQSKVHVITDFRVLLSHPKGKFTCNRSRRLRKSRSSLEWHAPRSERELR